MTVAESSAVRTHSPSMRSALQWGRNLTVAESPNPNSHTPICERLQWGRNLTVAESTAYRFTRTVRPALQWGRNLTVAERVPAARLPRTRRASMGPQLDSCGKPNLAEVEKRTGLLQWGRNLTVAESAVGRILAHLPVGASMGPQLDSCGKQVVAQAQIDQIGASMGPQLDSCGKGSAPSLAWCRIRSFNGAAT